MSNEPEISLKVLDAAIERYLFRDRDGHPVVRWRGEEMFLFPDDQARALVLAADAMRTLATLIPGKAKVSE